MTETNESQENQNEEEAAVPTMTTVERAEMLLQQDAAIRAKINGGAALDEAVDPSNKEFGPLAHPEQVQMRVARLWWPSSWPPVPCEMRIRPLRGVAATGAPGVTTGRHGPMGWVRATTGVG